MYVTKIEHCDYTLLNEQRAALIAKITSGERNNFFDVVDWEPGTGKSLMACEGIAKAVAGGAKVLFVRERNEQTVESAAAINELAGKTVALSFNNDSIQDPKERRRVLRRIGEYAVVVITHKRYQLLAVDSRQRRALTAGRTVLVVDEFPNMIDVLSLDLALLRTYQLLLAEVYSVRRLFDKIIACIENRLLDTNEEEKTGYIQFSLEKPNNMFRKLELLVRSNFKNDALQRRYARLLEDGAVTPRLGESITVGELCERFEQLKQFFQQVCVYENGVIYATDQRKRFWVLDGVNVLLDASADFRAAYNLDKKLFRREERVFVLDHSQWAIDVIPLKTTKNSRKNVLNFYDRVTAIAKSYGPDTLVVGAKEDMDKLDEIAPGCKAYHYNLVGSNQWRALKNVVICQTPELSDVNYLLRFLYYSKDFLDTIPSLSTKIRRRVNGSYSRTYEDPLLEQIRVLHLADHIYQAVKRVNRDMSQSTTVVLIMEEERVVELLCEQLRGVVVRVVPTEEWQFAPTARQVYDERRKQNSYAEKFKQFAVEVMDGQHADMQYRPARGETVPGRYKKKTVQEYLGVSDANNFRRLVLEQDSVLTFCETRRIIISRNYIDFPSEPPCAA